MMLGDTVELKVDCIQCGHTHVFRVPRNQFEAWERGTLIQDAFPELTPGQREILISKVCGDCFDKMFSEEEY